MNKQQNEKKQFVNQYMAQKAGMASVDKDKIAEIIHKITEGTPKSQYEQQMSQKRQLQLAQMLRKSFEFTYEQKKQIKQDWAEEIQKISKSRNLTKIWAHLDFDMFYVACQMLDKPELKDKPVAVGGDFSVVCTANYVARKYGVRSALPTFIAKKLCPELILIQPDFTKYKKYSNIFRDILRKFDRQLESMGLDEAYIELTEFMKDKTLQQQQLFINKIRQEIFKNTGLTVSCGVGANKMIAKLASEEKKPNGQFILQNKEQAILEFMKQKKIRKIPGIGPVNQFFLKGLGIESAQDILSNTDILTICFSSNSTEFYVSAALGLGSTQHEFVERKSVGKSQTFKATNDSQYLFSKLYEICQEVSMELEEIGYASKNVVFSYQNQNYSKKDKTFQLNKYTSNKSDLVQPILPYFQNFMQITKQRIRLIGVRCTSISRVQDLKKIQLDKYLNKTNQNGQLLINQKKQHRKSGLQNIGVLLEFYCPICNKEIDCKGNLSAFNRHIDKCMINEGDQGQKLQQKQIDERKKVKQIQQKVIKQSPQIQKIKSDKKNNNNNTLLSFLKKK